MWQIFNGLLCIISNLQNSSELPWAQGVGRSNRPAPTNRIISLQQYEMLISDRLLFAQADGRVNANKYRPFSTTVPKPCRLGLLTGFNAVMIAARSLLPFG